MYLRFFLFPVTLFCSSTKIWPVHREGHVKVSSKLSQFYHFDRIIYLNSFPFHFLLCSIKEDECLEYLEDEKLIGLLQSEQYDLGITENINFCGYAIFKRIGLNNHISARAVNLMEVSSDIFGVSSNPSYVPGLSLYISFFDVLSKRSASRILHDFELKFKCNLQG